MVLSALAGICKVKVIGLFFHKKTTLDLNLHIVSESIVFTKYSFTL